MATHLRTEFAMKALDLSDLFRALVGDVQVSGYRVEMSAPDGMSTAGGKQSLQHLKLVPEAGGPTIVAGTANQVEGTAELRSFEHLAELHAQRWKGALIPIDRAAYNELLRRMQDFFADKGLRLVLVEAARRPISTAQSTAPTGASSAGIVLAFIGVVLAMGAAIFLVLGNK